MVVYLENQGEFDALVRTVKQNAGMDFSFYSFINGRKTPNFTNRLEVIEYRGQKYLVKTSKFLSDLLYNAKSVTDFLKGKESGFSWNGRRQQREAEVIDELFDKGVNVPERAFTKEPGVLVLRYYYGEETKLVLRDERRYPAILEKLSIGLGKIHQIGLHGEPSTNNTFVSNGDSYWADFERFSRNINDVRKAREIIEFIKSASRHSYRSLESVANIVFESYPSSRVVDLARKAI